MQLTDNQPGTLYGEWGRKDATLSDTTARKEYGLTQPEIIHAIRAGQLQCREGSAHGNPFLLRLLRRQSKAISLLSFTFYIITSHSITSDLDTGR